MTIKKRIDSVKRGSGQIARTYEKIPVWVPPTFRKFYNFAKKWAQEFNKNLLQDREEDLIKEASKPFKHI